MRLVLQLTPLLGINSGTNSVCKACAASGRECSYPTPGATTTTPKRNDAPTGIKQEDGESKKRIRKIEDTGRRNSHKSGEDVLDSPILTRRVWDELYDIFKLHFLTEMPFLHPPSFRNRMRQAAFPRDPTAPCTDTQESKLLLLGVLTLTARFHTDLVAHHSPTGDPIAASGFYSSALETALQKDGNLSKTSLEVIQAWLMLSLYEWGQLRGTEAWVYLGIATRVAQAMRLNYEDDAGPGSHPYPPPKEQNNRTSDQILTEKEVRRRTWWSCFIMDRMLSAGKYRATMILVNKMRIQLPCSEDQFLFIKNVQTGHLKSDWERGLPEISPNDDGVLGWYIRLVEIFGRFSEWSYAGGRRTETERPPWNPETEFYKLRRDLDDFIHALPSNLAFSAANLSAHIEKRNATPYASMHTLYCLCLIMLHREFLPFIPLFCTKPIGPLDDPVFPADKFPPPDGFWETSAEIMFKAAKDIIDIVRICHDDRALPESPQIAFAIWQATFVCIYAKQFEQMDTQGHVLSSENGHNPNFRSGWTGFTSSLIDAMVPRLKMAKRHQTTAEKVHKFYARVHEDHWTGLNGNRPARFVGGGLEAYKAQEKDLKEFGGIGGHATAGDEERQSRATSTNDIGSNFNGEMQGVESSTPRSNGAWVSINGQSPEAEGARYNQLPTRPTSYQFPPQMGHNQAGPPSLISPSIGDSSSSINSPYSSVQTPHLYQPVVQSLPNGTYAPMPQHGMVSMAPPISQPPYQMTHDKMMATYGTVGWPAPDFMGDGWGVFPDNAYTFNYTTASNDDTPVAKTA